MAVRNMCVPTMIDVAYGYAVADPRSVARLTSAPPKSSFEAGLFWDGGSRLVRDREAQIVMRFERSNAVISRDGFGGGARSR